MNFSFDEIIFRIFQIYSDRKRWLIAQGSHAVLKVLNFKIGFQDFEKVLNLAKLSLRYWKKSWNSKWKRSECKVILHQLPKAGCAQDHDCDLYQFDNFLILAPTSDCQFFFSRRS